MGAYMASRLIALMLKPSNQFSSRFGQGIVTIISLVALVIVFSGCVILLLTGSSAGIPEF